MISQGTYRNITPDYECFPHDGVSYWLRWLDRVDVRGNGSGHPTFHAYLSPLSFADRLPSLGEVADTEIGYKRCAVQVASLPDLQLGRVYRNGAAVGSLSMVPRTFAFQRPACTSALMRCDDSSPMAKPHWWKYKWSVLPANAYALGERSSAWCLVLRDDVRQLIIPASEIFRVFCAPESLLAEALLSGPWSEVRDRIVNSSWTELHPESWQIGLRTGLTGASALPAAAFDFSDYGRAVAGLIYAQLLGTSGGLADLKADIPYEWRAIELDVEGVPFPSEREARLGLDRFLCLRIVGVKWPGPLIGLPSEVVYRLDNYSVERDLEPPPAEDAQPIPRASAPLPDDIRGTVPVAPSIPAVGGIAPVSAMVPPTPTFVGGPVVVRLALAESTAPRRPRRRTIPIDPADHSSPTRSGPGARDAAPLRHVGEPEASVTGFTELADALDGLVDDGSIQDWWPTKPDDDMWNVCDGFHAWCFPGRTERRIAWAYVAGSRRRTALVCRIAVDGRVLHLLEIERWTRTTAGSPRGFSMLLLEAAEPDMQQAVACLLRIAADRRGVWPDDATWETARAAIRLGAVPIMRRRHDYLETTRDPADQTAPRRLDAALLIRWMRLFMAADPIGRDRTVGSRRGDD